MSPVHCVNNVPGHTFFNLAPRPGLEPGTYGLVILGDGNKKSKLENKIIELELSEFIKLPGIVGNLTDWYLRADLYVMSSQSEDFPDP